VGKIKKNAPLRGGDRAVFIAELKRARQEVEKKIFLDHA
jgi:hypothetical protein